MAAPDNAADLLPVSWQVGIAGLTFLGTSIGVGWKFLQNWKAPESHSDRVVLEQADLADLKPIRDLIHDFKPALEKISRIEGMTNEMRSQVAELCVRMERIERAALIAKEVREELARRKDEDDRDQHRRDRRHRDD